MKKLGLGGIAGLFAVTGGLFKRVTSAEPEPVSLFEVPMPTSCSTNILDWPDYPPFATGTSYGRSIVEKYQQEAQEFAPFEDELLTPARIVRDTSKGITYEDGPLGKRMIADNDSIELGLRLFAQKGRPL